MSRINVCYMFHLCLVSCCMCDWDTMTGAIGSHITLAIPRYTPRCPRLSVPTHKSPCLNVSVSYNCLQSCELQLRRYRQTTRHLCSLLEPSQCRFKDCQKKLKFTIGSELAVVVWCHAHWNRGFPSSNLNRPLTRSLHLAQEIDTVWIVLY